MLNGWVMISAYFAIMQSTIPLPTKDCWDKAAVVADCLLVTVGAFGIIYAALTFRKLTEQTEAVRDSVQEQRKAAEISRGTAIPTLRIIKFNMRGSDPLVDNEMEITVKNHGASPAILDNLYASFDDGERWPGKGIPIAYADKAGRAVAANSEEVLECSPTMCLVSPQLIPKFRVDLKPLYVHGQLTYLDVFASPVRSLRFDICLSPRQSGMIHCEIISQWNEYEGIPEKTN